MVLFWGVVGGLVVAAILGVGALGRRGVRDINPLSVSVERMVILLTDSAPAEGRSLDDVWAHELAHALGPTAETQTPSGREQFAEALGPRLLAKQPSTLAEAAPLIATANRQRPLPIGTDAANLLCRVLDW